MLNTNTLAVTIAVPETTGEHLELCRLLAAATVNPDFERLLLNEPQLALQQGYEEEAFLLSPQERDLVLSIRAASLAELAGILVQTLGERAHTPCQYTAQAELSYLH
jgi:hypothetical protein